MEHHNHQNSAEDWSSRTPEGGKKLLQQHHDHSSQGDEIFDEHGNLKLASMEQNNKNVFCKSGGMGGMIMYMDGFRSSLAGGGADKPCLNLLFPSWTLDSRFKFGSACVAVFFLALSVEGFSKLRHKIVRLARQQGRQQREGALPQQERWSSLHPSLVRLTVTILHGTQALLGYVLMLVTMTFSIELLLCVVMGLAAGYAVFFQITNTSNSNNEFPENDDEDLHVTSNPCCEFMAEESREQQQQAAIGSRRRARWASSSNAAVTTEHTDSSSLTTGLLAAEGTSDPSLA